MANAPQLGHNPNELWFWAQRAAFIPLKCYLTLMERRKRVEQLLLTWSLWTSPMHKAKHVSASLTDSSHLSKNRKVVNNEGHLVSLLLGKVLCVSQDSKPCDVRSCVCVESVHESSSFKRGRKHKKKKSGKEVAGKVTFQQYCAQFEWSCVPSIQISSAYCLNFKKSVWEKITLKLKFWTLKLRA